MVYLAFALAFMSGIAGGVYLVLQGHPWFALLVFILAGCLQVTNGKKGDVG